MPGVFLLQNGRVLRSYRHANPYERPDYEALALGLAREPALLNCFRQTLARNLDTCPLFDTDRFRRHIEAAYATMWEICQRGEAPHAVAVEADLQSRA